METQENPVKPKRKGQPTEHMKEISKIGNDLLKKKGEITRYEKAKKKKDIEEKFAMIQEEIMKKNAPEPEPEPVPERIPTPEPELPEPELPEPKPKIRKKKTREIVEIVEEDEDEDDEEEEVVVKRIIKRKPIAKKHYQDEDDMIQKTNIELLKNKLNVDVRRRLMASLFDC